MTSSSRGVRRHHAERLREKRRTYHGGYDPSRTELGRRVHTATPCSCSMCCSPRYSPWHRGEEKLTMQERRALEVAE